MNPDVMPGSEPHDTDMAKSSLLRDAVPLIEGRIGRSMDTTEIRAVGFVLDRSRDGGAQPEDFLRRLGVADQSSPVDIAWAIRDAVKEALEQEIGARLGGDGSMSPEAGKLQSMRGLIEDQHAMALGENQQGKIVPLGAVPDDWLPVWLKEIRR